MSEHVLVSPLGFSPGAVSGLAFALIEENYPISWVITVGTAHEDVKASAQILETLFHDMDILYKPLHIPATELRQSEDSTDAFVSHMGLALESACKDRNKVHVGVTGGRSGMGALAALATNLYGADHLWHLWVEDYIEKGGRSKNLLPTIENQFLNPTVVPDAYELVDLPLVDLRPLHPIIWEYYKDGREPDPHSALYQLFQGGQIKRLQDVFPAGLTMSKADELINLIRTYKDMDPGDQDKAMMELGSILAHAGVIDEATKTKLQKLVKAGLPSNEVLAIAKTANDKMDFWKVILKNQDTIGVTSNVIAAMLQGIVLYLQIKGFM